MGSIKNKMKQVETDNDTNLFVQISNRHTVVDEGITEMGFGIALTLSTHTGGYLDGTQTTVLTSEQTDELISILRHKQREANELRYNRKKR